MGISDRYSGDQFPYVLMGSGAGTSNDPVFYSSGTMLTYKSQAGGTATGSFLGVLVNTTGTGAYGAVQCEGIVSMPKTSATDVVELGELICIGTSSSTTSYAGTVAIGTHIGVCAKRSASTDSYIDVKLIPGFIRA